MGLSMLLICPEFLSFLLHISDLMGVAVFGNWFHEKANNKCSSIFR